MPISSNNGSLILKHEQDINNGNLKIAVNSIQRTLFVERMWVDKKFPVNEIIPYDVDNLYPNKIKSIAQRSSSTKSAIQTLSSFLSGRGFNGMNIIVNRNKQTLWDILKLTTNSIALFGGYAWHFNYNIFGQIAEWQFVNFDYVRWSKDLKSFTINPDWSKRYLYRDEQKIFNIFDPLKVQDEIKNSGGLNKYEGQLLYSIPDKTRLYNECNWDQVLDDAQFEAETKLYSLSSIQNDYSLSGLVTLPKALVSEDEKENLKQELKQDQGAGNAGGVRVISAMPAENLSQWKWFTPINRNNIDSLHTNQIERAKFNIYAAFQQPPILNGISKDGMFNQDSYADAFHYYNSYTETKRQEIEAEMNKIISLSIWNLEPIRIEPKIFLTREINNVGK